MKIVVTPAYLGRQIGALRTTAAGLEAQRNRVARVSYPPMPAATMRSVMASVERARTDLTGVSRECAAMAAQLTKRKDFHPPEAYPSFAPTAALTKDAERRAERLAKKIHDGKANIKDDIAFANDPEFQLQLALLLGEKAFAKYLKQVDQRFKFAQELMDERNWKQRKDQEMAGYWNSHEKFLGKHHLGWAYPKGFVTGVFKGGSSLDASIYSVYGMLHDQWSPERKKAWKDLGLPTNTESVGASLEYAMHHRTEFVKALVAWDTFAGGRIGEGLGEVSFTATLFYATGGTGSASTALRSASVLRRGEIASAAAARSAALASADAEASAIVLRAAATESRTGTGTAGAMARNSNFERTRLLRQVAQGQSAEATSFAAQAAEARQLAASLSRQKWAQVRLAGASLVTGWVGLDVTRLRSVRNWLLGTAGTYVNASGLRSPDQVAALPETPRPPRLG